MLGPQGAAARFLEASTAPKRKPVFRRWLGMHFSREAKLFCSSKSDFSFGQYTLRILRASKIFKTSVAQAWERLRKIAWERFFRFLSSGGAFGDRFWAISRLGQRGFRCWMIFEFSQNIGGHSVLIFHPSPRAGHSHLIFLNPYFYRVKKTPFERERGGHSVKNEGNL